MREARSWSYSSYTNPHVQRLFTDEVAAVRLPDPAGIVGWGFAGRIMDKAFVSRPLGLRADGTTTRRAGQLWHQLSPRASVGYQLGRGWSLSRKRGRLLAAALYGARIQGCGCVVNKSPLYARRGFSAGAGWRLRDRLIVGRGFTNCTGCWHRSRTGFRSPQGQRLRRSGQRRRSSGRGRSYGVEAMARWQIPGKVNLVGSVTLFRSEYRRDSAAPIVRRGTAVSS